jgi:alkylation response protein AidB-like acyl-CoA dehydrogenase
MRLTSEQLALQDAIGDFVKVELPPGFARECDESQSPPIEQYRKLASAGYLGIAVPERFGGSGGTITDLCVMLHALAKGMMSFSIMVYRSAVHGAQSLLAYGNDEQRERFLPKIIAGEALFCLSLTEPGAGSDAASLQLRAELDGDEFVLNGQKLYNSSAHIADYILLAARTSREGVRHAGISLFIVDTRSPGLDIRRVPTMGERAVGTNEVFYDNVRVPAANLLGELNRGWYQLQMNLELERLSMAAWCTGAAQSALRDSIEWAKTREQFGKPIGAFQAISHMIADMALDCYLGELMLFELADRVSQGEKCPTEASMTKLFCTEMYSRVANAGLQVHGGYGYTMQSDMQLHVRDARIMTIGGGSSQIMRNVIARNLGLPS